MPFDFNKFEDAVEEMRTDDLQRMKHKYTKDCGKSSIGASASLVFGPLMFIGLGVAASTAGNAAGKLTIISRELRRRKEDPHLDLSQVARGQLEATLLSQAGHGIAHITNSEAFGYAAEQGLDYGWEKASEARGNSK